MESGPGYQDDVDVHLSRLVNLDLSPPYQKLVVVTIDEMKIKEDLVFNKHSRRSCWICPAFELLVSYFVNKRILCAYELKLHHF